MVPETGLEPAHQMAYAPKAYVYTNFTTRARLYYTTERRKKRGAYASRFLHLHLRFALCKNSRKTIGRHSSEQ